MNEKELDLELHELETLKDTFIKKLQIAVKNASNEDRMDDLEHIAVNTLAGIPIQLLQSDFYPRSTVKNFIIPECQRNNKEYVDKVMDKVWENDCVCFTDDYIQESLKECIDEIEQ